MSGYDYTGLVAALRVQRQIDEDGTEVGVSRQAVCEAADTIADLIDVLRRNGFVECDIPACNCGSWHRRPDQDAERYRWLRGAGPDKGGPFIAQRHPASIVSAWTGQEADTAIDAAMKDAP